MSEAKFYANYANYANYAKESLALSFFMPETGGMALYTAAEIKAKIEALDAKIAKAESAQSYGAGAGMQLARGDLDAMYRERKRLETLYAQAEAGESGGGHTLVQFQRPT